MTAAPALTQFRLEFPGNGLVHLVFDCPGRTMNVFSNAAIEELGAFATWLAEADVKGVLIRSGKSNGFCAGADLTELGFAYDMIMAAPKRSRFDLAFDHFFRLGHAMRKLETAGKPIAAAIAGIALGGGCELAMAAHHRILVDDPKVAMGLPESLVGLLPGAGGTQRLPRLIGIEAALPILLEGIRLSGARARDVGLVDTLCAAGDEIGLGEAWLLANPGAVQPWDRDDWRPPAGIPVGTTIAPVRARVLADTLGHYPAPLAILDCIEFGAPQSFDGAIRTEMSIFSHLIQREEARNMIQTLFLAKTEFERLKRAGTLPGFVGEVEAAARAALAAIGDDPALGAAGFSMASAQPVRDHTREGYWIDTPEGARARALLDRIGAALVSIGVGLSPDQRRLADYAVVTATGYPPYLGGPFALAARSPAPSLAQPIT